MSRRGWCPSQCPTRHRPRPMAISTIGHHLQQRKGNEWDIECMHKLGQMSLCPFKHVSSNASLPSWSSIRFIAAALIFGLSVTPNILWVVVLPPVPLEGGANDGGSGWLPQADPPLLCSGRKIFFTSILEEIHHFIDNQCISPPFALPKFS